MKILIVAGHALRGKGTGAVGYINESNENRILSKKVVEWLKSIQGIEADYYEINEASDYLQKQVAAANKKNYDVVVQIHFNAGGGTGTETLHDRGSVKGKEYAIRVNEKLNDIFKNRGAKERNDLYWLNNTKAPAILIETCFVDSKADVDIYNKDKDKVAKAIAEGITGKTINKPAENTNTFYRVVAGSYTNKANAEVTVNELKSKGYSAFIATFTKDGTLYYRAVAGSYSVRANADAQISKLKSDGYSAFIEVYKK